MSEKRLLLVDGANVAYRAYFAIPGLSTRSGCPTNAVFGFIRMLRQWERRWKPTHWVIVFDGGTPQERLDLLADYKANRPDMPDALRQQFPLIEEFLAGARIACLRIDGCEADDVIASAIEQKRQEFDEILVVSSDKDLYQLVTEQVQMISPAKGDDKIGIEGVRQKTGVGPERVVELLALTGDAVDNVPGVPGIGPKTAVRLLEQCPSLAAFPAGLDNVSSDRIRESLLQHKDRIMRNLKIIHLRADIPIRLSVADMEVRPPDGAVLLPYFERMEFDGMADALRTPLLI